MKFYHEQNKPLLLEYDLEFFPMSSERIEVTAIAHVHSAVEIIYVTEGNYKIDSDGMQTYASQGDIVVFPSNTVHSIYHLEKRRGEYYVLKLTPDILFRVFKGGNSIECIAPFIKRQSNNRTIFRQTEIPGNMSMVWNNMIAEYEKKTSTMYAMQKIYALNFLLLFYRNLFQTQQLDVGSKLNIGKDIRKLIYESVNFINENYASDITPAQCAKRINLSYSYYNKAFHAVIGKGFKEYLTALRLAKARNAIIATNLPITDIALSYGYKSTAYFISEFKKAYGETPGETRKKTAAEKT